MPGQTASDIGAPALATALSVADYAAISAFRFRLRQFLVFSEAVAGTAGLPPQQHQALLAIAGHEEDAPPCVGTLAEELLIAPHSAAELANRMVRAGLVSKRTSRHDRRRIELRLTCRARALLADLTRAHLDELRTLKPALVRALHRLDAERAGPSDRSTL
ncbi:MAG: MarR family winged helix-turn-helix transcriptional regulator [Caulobacteraceae bacterium]